MKTWVKALLAGSLALGPAAAFAAIDNSHHDMPYLTVSNERCAYCHSKTSLAAAASLGKVGNFCVAVCHQAGAGIDGPRPQVVPSSPGTYTYAAGVFTMADPATDATMFYPGGHQRSVPALAVFAAGEATQVPVTGWPYTNNNELQCTSCHAVHDSSNPPFLNGQLAVTAPLNPQTDGFCQRCHNDAGRWEDFTVTGDHPTEFEWDPTAAGLRGTTNPKTDGTVASDRDLVVGVGVTNINVVATGVADGAAGNALDALTASWNLGGHVINNATGLPQTGNSAADTFGCYSCHAVHVATPAAGWNGSLANPMTVGSNMTDVCYGCHTMEPGQTGFGHPIDEDEPLNHASAGGGWDVVPIEAATWAAIPAAFKPGADSKAPVKAGALNAPYCVSCHDVHNARPNRMAIRNDAGMLPLPADGAVCELCHAAGAGYDNPVVANKHHPGATGTNYTAQGFAANTAWYTTDGLGDLDDGLSCGDCHIGDGSTTHRATAHNWQ